LWGQSLFSPKDRPDNCQGFVLVSDNWHNTENIYVHLLWHHLYEQMVVGGQTRKPRFLMEKKQTHHDWTFVGSITLLHLGCVCVCVVFRSLEGFKNPKLFWCHKTPKFLIKFGHVWGLISTFILLLVYDENSIGIFPIFDKILNNKGIDLKICIFKNKLGSFFKGSIVCSHVNTWMGNLWTLIYDPWNAPMDV
jgi:hypothetical protein